MPRLFFVHGNSESMAVMGSRRVCVDAIALLGLFRISVTICVLLVVSGCISSTSSLDLAKLRPVHSSEPVSDSKQSVNVLLVERESGGLIAITDTHMAYFDRDFKFERKVKFKHKYYGFGLIQGPDGPWFTGYEWWSWMFGILHNMNFDIHAMPLGDSEPRFTWPCKNCSDLRVRRFEDPPFDYLYAASVRHAPPWVGFEVGSGERFGEPTTAELIEVLAEHRREESSRTLESGDEVGSHTYSSRDWWRYAYATCSSGSRDLWGMRGGRYLNCVWHPQRSNPHAEFTVGMDRTYNRVALRDESSDTEIDSWDLSGLVDVVGFSHVMGWFRFPDSECDGDGGGSATGSECAKTVAVLSGTWESCYEKTRCEEATGVFELEDGGRARLLSFIRAPSRASVRLSDGRIVVSVDRNLVLFDPPSSVASTE